MEPRTKTRGPGGLILTHNQIGKQFSPSVERGTGTCEASPDRGGAGLKGVANVFVTKATPSEPYCGWLRHPFRTT